MKTPVINSLDYIVYFEYSFNMTFIHCTCYRWSKSVKHQLKADFDKLVEIHRSPIFAIHEINDSKHLKFLDMMDFKYHSDFVGADGQTRQLFVRIK
jgi:hypothetical protein